MNQERKPILYSLGSRFLIISVAMLVIIMTVATWFGISVIRKNMRREMEGHLESDSAMSQIILKDRLQGLENLTSLTSSNNTLKVTFELGIIPQLEEHLKKIVFRNNLDLFMITDDSGLPITCSPYIKKDFTFLKEQISEALLGKLSSGFTLAVHKRAGKELMMITTSPIRVRKKVVGAISLGRLATSDTELTRLMDENMSADVLIWQIGKGVILSTLAADGIARFSTYLNRLLDEIKQDKEKTHISDIRVDKKNFLTAAYLLKDFHDRSVAHVVLVRDTKSLKMLEKQTIRNMILISLSGICVAVFFITIITRSISRPIAKTVKAMVAVTEKDDLTQHVDIDAKGEVGKLVSTFNNMVETIRESREKLEDLANTLDQKVMKRTRELEEAQTRLINSAMEARRVQLSAMILHNIGNAVTPINAQIQRMKSRESRHISDYLESSYLDLGEHRQDLQQYINADPRGRRVFTYMGKLIDSLKGYEEQNAEIVNKIDSGISYISEVLTLQQAYAASEKETKEQTDLNTLIEDAIRMQTGVLEKRGIIIQKDLDTSLPRLLINKNKLMQVIVNLIKNSYDAIDESDDDGKEGVITLRSFADNGQVNLEITDNGIGIDPEFMDRIFEFGKSSKESSGFGLYYCKMFVESNKGTLNISSQGRERGATVKISFEV